MDRSQHVVSAADLPFTEAVGQARDPLRAVGHGVLCEKDAEARCEEKLGLECE